jgi:hypothetical protein
MLPPGLETTTAVSTDTPCRPTLVSTDTTEEEINMCESLEGDLVCDANGNPGEQPHAEDRCPCLCDQSGAEAQTNAEEGPNDDSVHAKTRSYRPDQEA